MSSFESARDEALSIALSSKDTLQESLSVAKHGSTTKGRAPTLTIRSLLYGSVEPVKTICIHKCSNEYSVSYLWYSLSRVYFRDVYLSVQALDDCVRLYMDRDKLDLYVISLEDIVSGLQEGCKYPLMIDIVGDPDDLCIEVNRIPGDIMLKCVRASPIDCIKDDWEVTGSVGEIQTVFKGDKYSSVYPYCDVTLSTNVNITIRHLGKTKAAVLYRMYASGEHIDLYLSRMVTSSDDEVVDYGNMAKDDIIKRMTIRDQISNIVESSLRGDVDLLSSRESRLMAGLDLNIEVTHPADDIF